MNTPQKLTGPDYTGKGSRPSTSRSAHSTSPANIILINADTFRYDNLFDRAAMPVRTPHLDAFSRRAISMDRFYAGSFPTIPERTELISGRYNWPWYGWQPLIEKNLMPRLLASRGYVTQLLCDCPHLFNANFHTVFDAAFTLRGQEGDTYFLHMNSPIEEVMPREKTRTGYHFQGRNLVDLHRWINRDWRCEEDTFPPRTASLAARWLEENYQFRPFFLEVEFFDPHEPWDPPEYLVRRYDPDYEGTPMLHPNYGKAGDYTPAELRNLRAHYCAEAELVDRWVGRIFQKIDDLGLWDSIIVIFTSDHGTSLGEHNRTGKTNINTGDDRRWPLYPEIAHIPFLVASPGLDGGQEIDLLAQPVDILPTLLDLAGLQVTPPEPFHGRSFAPALRGQAQAPLHEMAVCGQFLPLQGGVLPPTATTPALYTSRWAYVPAGPDGQRELYDLEADPYAETNLAPEQPEIVDDLHGQFLQWLKDRNAPEDWRMMFDKLE